MKSVHTRFVYFLLALSFICFLSFALAYGYDESTMENEVVGEIAVGLLSMFKFPFFKLFPDGDFMICLFASVPLYSVLGVFLFHLYEKSKAKG